MIEYIQGRLVNKKPTGVIVDANGIGYNINITLTAYEKLPSVNDEVKIIPFFVLILSYFYDAAGFFYPILDLSDELLFDPVEALDGVLLFAALNNYYMPSLITAA